MKQRFMDSKTRSFQKAHWDGRLTLAQGWAHYHGPIGQAKPHAHYAAQFVFCQKHDISVTFRDHQRTGRSLFIASHQPHSMIANGESVDLFFVEPTLLGDIHKKPMAFSDCITALKQSVFSASDARIKAALETIENSLAGKINQARIARAAAMSKSSFTKTFHATMGMPLRRYVLWRRLTVAIAAIGRGSDATTAAHEAGFSDSAHFSRTMTKTFGVSPKDSLLRIKMTAVAP